MQKNNVNVITIKPGFVDSPMTAHLEKGLLFSSTQKIASCIKSAIDKNKNVAYTPFFWGIIMFIVIHIPESIFKRLKM
jgi:short-subunit dehydrogenase